MNDLFNLNIHNLFNIRIYGILIENGKVLVTDEFRLGIKMTKFPGGGLEFGEGPIDCLIREWKEETGIEIRVNSHFYTTDFFQPSYNLPGTNQIINIYYKVEAIKPYDLKTKEIKFDFNELTEGIQTFRWVDMDSITEEEFTLPIDKVVVKMLTEDRSMGHLTWKSK
jgi:8-oxo-dGTP diphosphatase